MVTCTLNLATILTITKHKYIFIYIKHVRTTKKKKKAKVTDKPLFSCIVSRRKRKDKILLETCYPLHLSHY